VLVSRQLVNITTWSGGWDNWAAGRVTQTSAPLNLAAGDLLLLEAVHSQGPGGTQLQVHPRQGCGAPHNAAACALCVDGIA
jgi:hypothetical protein